MTDKEANEFWKRNAERFFDIYYYSSECGLRIEDVYQAFKHRLMAECSVIPRWTDEEAEEWKKKMTL